MKKKTSDFWLLIYKAIWIVVMLMKAVPWLDWHLSPYIRLLLIPGALLILWEYFVQKKMWSKSLVFLIGFCVAYGCTALLARGDGFAGNLKSVFYMAVAFLLFYGHDREREPALVKREIKILGRLFVTGTFLLAAICFATFLFSYNQVYTWGEKIGYIGMWDNRLWGLYNANTGGALNVISLLILSGLFLAEEKKSWRVFYVGNGILQFLCLVLTYSRTSFYSLILALCIGIFFLLPHWDQEKRMKRNVKSLGFRLVIVLLIPLLFVTLEKVTRWGLSYLPGIVQEVTGEAEWDGQREVLDRIETLEHREGGILTGRPILWEAGWHAFLESPVFGVGRENLYERSMGYLSDPSWAPDLAAGGVHNGYLTLLISSGLLGTACLALFWIRTVWQIFRMVRKKKEKLDLPFCIGGILLLLYFIMEVLEARILYQVNIFMALYWMVYGYVMYFTERAEGQTH